MKVTFIKDENDSIWLYYAENIQVRYNEIAKLAMDTEIKHIRK